MVVGKILSFAFYAIVILAIIGALFFVLSDVFATSLNPLVQVQLNSPVSDAGVSIYALNDDGTRGELLAGPLQTDADGLALFKFTKRSSYILVEASGGVYNSSAASGSQPTRLLRADIMRAVAPADSAFVAVTPFSDMAASLALSSMKKGASQPAAVSMATSAVSRQYHVRNVSGTVPISADNEAEMAGAFHSQREYGIVLSGFMETAASLGARPADLMRALSSDWSDGVLDGMQNGQQIEIPTSSGSVNLPSTAATSGLQNGIDAFLTSPQNSANLNAFPTATSPVCSNADFYITTTTLPVWRDGTYGDYELSVGGSSQSGGIPNATWKLKEGSTLPAGFELNVDGIISGTASLQPGSAESISPPFIVVATDASNSSRVCEAELRITLSEQPPKLAPASITCTVDTACSQSIVSFASGGTPPYHFESFAPDSGDSSPDLMLWADGTIKGVPKTSGEFAMNVCVIDLIGWSDCRDIAIHVKGKTKTTTTTTTTTGGSSSLTCEPGHYATTCGGKKRCCLNGWVCCGGSCKPPSLCG